MRLGLVATCLVFVGCAGARTATAPVATRPPSLRAALPPRCPHTAPVRLPGERWPPARRQLAPAGASAIRLCRYAGLNARPRFALVRSRLLRDGRLVRILVHAFDGLPLFPRGPVNCPNDDGSQIVALLAYPNDHVVTISIGLTGCRGVGNGSVARSALPFGHPPPAFDPQLIAQLEAMVPSRSGRGIRDAGAEIARPPLSVRCVHSKQSGRLRAIPAPHLLRSCVA